MPDSPWGPLYLKSTVVPEERTLMEVEILHKYMDEYRCSTVCDYGCGTGRHLAHMKKYNSYGFETDSFTRGLCFELTGTNPLNLNFRRSPILNVDCIYSMQNTLFCFDAPIHTVWSVLTILQTVSESLVPGGLLIFEIEELDISKTKMKTGSFVLNGVTQSWKPIGACLEVTLSSGDVSGTCYIVTMTEGSLLESVKTYGKVISREKISDTSTLWVTQKNNK